MRQLTLLVAIVIAFFVTLSLLLMSQTSSLRSSSVLHNTLHTPESSGQATDIANQASGLSLDLLESDIARTKLITPALTQGPAIMPHLTNETIKAELGRASWKLFHTILGRYPEKPSLDEREALKSYIHLFARLYPCGECAEHFQALLVSHPPQTSSREAAAQWGCHIHNKVNESLNKKIFDCSTISEVYMCGCDDEKDGKSTDTKSDSTMPVANTDQRRPAGESNRGSHTPLEFDVDGLTRGG